MATWWSQPDRVRVAVANFAIILFAPALTGVSALLIEDALPKPGEHATLIPLRLIVFLVLLALLSGAVWLRTYSYRVGGTLYYAHALAEGMSDRRRAALDKAADNHLALRTVSRWIDIEDRTTIDGVIDIHGLCSEIGANLESLINADNPETGYTLAPNLLWPIAISVGAYLPPARRTRIMELDPPDGQPLWCWLGDDRKADFDHSVEQLDAEADSSRIGVLLGFTQHAEKFDTETFSDFGVGSVRVLSASGGLPATGGASLTADQIAGLAHSVVAELKTLTDTSNELVFVAFIPEIVAVASGFELARQGVRFFAGHPPAALRPTLPGVHPDAGASCQPRTRPTSSR